MVRNCKGNGDYEPTRCESSAEVQINKAHVTPLKKNAVDSPYLDAIFFSFKSKFEFRLFNFYK